EWDFSLPEGAKVERNSLDQANFYFATRQFEKGKTVLEGIVKSYPAKDIGPYELRQALLSLAVYYARVKEDPKTGFTYFSGIAKKSTLPAFLRKEVGAWAEDFSEWAKGKNGMLEKAEPTQLVQHAKTLLQSDNFSLVEGSDRSFHIR